MNGLRDLLKKKEHIAKDSAAPQPPPPSTTPATTLDIPEFTFIRTTTESEEVIQPPDYPGDNPTPGQTKGREELQPRARRRTLGFRRPSSAISVPKLAGSTSTPSSPIEASDGKGANTLPVRPKSERRLSERLHLGSRSRSKSSDGGAGSAHLPEDLPAAPEVALPRITVDGAGEAERREADARREALWEKRATVLASRNPLLENEVAQRQPQDREVPGGKERGSENTRPGTASSRDRSPSISDKPSDADIQEAIRLHESGDLPNSTRIFGRLASPTGANNALAQVLYGLALRHGWGIPPSQSDAIHWLSLAASNSAAVEKEALEHGMTKGGAAKGELVLAIYELGNCFRHGWGVKRDAVAARGYYETAANLGDTDAMEEAAWCLLEGFGGGKDKFKAAQYLRLAEQKGSKSVGNSWIWKDKYNPK